MTNSPLADISKDICIEAVNLSKLLIEQKQFDISRQFVRSCSSIGANVREAQFAESKKDFIHKLNISLKECNESLFWINILIETNLVDESLLKNLRHNCMIALKMLKSSIKTTKERYGA